MVSSQMMLVELLRYACDLKLCMMIASAIHVFVHSKLLEVHYNIIAVSRANWPPTRIL